MGGKLAPALLRHLLKGWEGIGGSEDRLLRRWDAEGDGDGDGDSDGD